jgi:hypothetical protein
MQPYLVVANQLGVDHQGSPQTWTARPVLLDASLLRRIPDICTRTGETPRRLDYSWEVRRNETRNSPRQEDIKPTTMASFRVESLAYPGVVSLVSFLAFTSQWLFHHIQPGPLRKGEPYIFNILVAALLICYTRTCYTDPGRIPHDWHENIETKNDCARLAAEVSSRQRYCRKCEMPKPPRAHHCKTCKR